MDQPQYPTLAEALKTVPDPRRARGKIYPWLFLLVLICAALAAGKRKLSEISDWVKYNGEVIRGSWPDLLPRLPSYATLRRALIHVDLQALEAAIAPQDAGSTIPGSQTPKALEDPPRGQAVDGKTLRGTLNYASATATHLVSVVQHDPVCILAQRRVETPTHSG